MRAICLLFCALALASAPGCARDRGETTTTSARRAASQEGARVGAREDGHATSTDDDARAERDARAEHDDAFAASAPTTGGSATSRGTPGTEGAAQPIAAATERPPTAGDQPVANDDEAITRQVRRSVVGDGSLSILARNATIVTRGGVVTLRGTVARPEERLTLERHARAVPGVSRVDNRLAVRD